MGHFLRALSLFILLTGIAQAHDKRFPSMWVDDLLIHAPVLKATPEGAPVAAGYMGIENTGDTDEVLKNAGVEFAKDVQLHEMAMSGDVMKMRQIEGGIVIPAGETVWLKPGGLHLMLMKPSEALIEGKKQFVTLEFETAGTVRLPFVIATLDTIRTLSDELHHNHDN